MTEAQPDQTHRATFTVTVASRPDGGHYFDRDDFSAHVAGWLKAGLKGRHAIAEVTVAETPSATRADDQAGLRDRIAALFRNPPGAERLGDATPGEIADAVLAVLPPTADRAAVLNAAAQHLYTALFPAVYNDLGQKAAEGVNRAVSELRRMADEAQQPDCDHDSQIIDHEGARYWACMKCGTNLGRVEDEAQQQPESDVRFGVEDCTCRPWTRKNGEARYLDRPADTVDMISGWERDTACPHHASAGLQTDVEQPAAANTDADHVAPHCDGFPTTCPNRVTVPPAPPHHGGGIRCGCYDEEQPS